LWESYQAILTKGSTNSDEINTILDQIKSFLMDAQQEDISSLNNNTVVEVLGKIGFENLRMDPNLFENPGERLIPILIDNLSLKGAQ
jgi:hypothetical protein